MLWLFDGRLCCGHSMTGCVVWLFDRKLTGCSHKRTDAAVAKAKRVVSRMTAHMGGTEMMKPFTWIYQQELIEDNPRQVRVWGRCVSVAGGCMGKCVFWGKVVFFTVHVHVL